MRRTWLGIGLMVILIGLGIFETCKISQLEAPLSELLDAAAQAALEQDLEQTGALLTQAQSQWEGHWDFLAAMTHHGPMEEIDNLFARAESLLQSQAIPELAACCTQISQQVQALADAHRLTLRNLL